MIGPEEDRARAFAQTAHDKQRYGDEPYVVHLAEVRTVLSEYGFTGPILVAAWLHDTLEDTKVSFKEIRDSFGDEVAAHVVSVTGVGKNRKERNASIVKRLASYPHGIPLKLADRIANGRRCLKGNPELLTMYQREYLGFKGELQPLIAAVPPRIIEACDRMWIELDQIMAAGLPS